MRTATFGQLHSAIPQERVEQARDYWDRRTIFDVMEEMPVLQRHGNADIAIVEPEGYADEENTLVLPLEFTQGYTPPHYMRAKVLQQYVAPNSRVVIMPNSTFGARHVDLNSFTKNQKKQLKSGDYMPYGRLLMKTLEEADSIYNFGNLGLVGSSQAGTSVLAIIASGSDRVSVDSGVAIEVPSKTDRELPGLAKDFMASGGNLAEAVKGSEISAQSEVMSGMDLWLDLGKFAVRSMCKESRLIARSLTGSIDEIAKVAITQLPPESISILHVEGSSVFDPESLSEEVKRSIQQTKIVGREAQAHSTPNNLRFNAAMAYDGLSKKQA